MAVELLLASSEHPTANEFSTEVAGQGINDDHLDVQALAHALDLVSEKHLVSGVVGACDVDAGEHVVGVEAVASAICVMRSGRKRVFVSM